jgi:glycosyltransferase involved in cell wall biosynthesis
VVIPVYNQVDLLERCLASLQQQSERRIEVLVVDDASPEDPGPVVAAFPAAKLIRQGTN